LIVAPDSCTYDPVVAYPIGVVDLAFAPLTPIDAAVRARELGFEHIDMTQLDGAPDPFSWDGQLALPVHDHCVLRPRSGCTCSALPEGDGMWDRAIASYRRYLPIRMEPWPGSIVNSVEKVRAMLDAVPGLGLTVDTGHVATWGEDPVELISLADHVQLRQAARDDPQRHADAGGDVDFAAVLRALDASGYEGALSIEYLDLPNLGLHLDDPEGHAVALLHHVRELQSQM
jgi:Xylose isomerase-like TIM barrel